MSLTTASHSLRLDYEALTREAGLCPLDERIVVRVAGSDRLSFLQGMCTNDVRSLDRQGVMYALFLTEHAHIVADFYAWSGSGELWLEVDGSLWATARANLERFLVADDVEMERIESLAVLDLEGPRAAEALRWLGGASLQVPGPWCQSESRGVRIGNVPRLGTTAFTLIGESGKLAEVASNPPPWLRMVDRSALELMRIERGLARVGVDTSSKTIALEAGLERAISFNKGCYLGQETIERATAHGALKKRLTGLRFEARQAPEPNAAVWVGDREVGRLTSAALSLRGGWLGLAILHHSAWTPGTSAIIKQAAGDLQAVVSALPFNLGSEAESSTGSKGVEIDA
jgi:folate-binding protein YgfZ